jgi:electron transport complex protein RnfC
MTEDEMKKSEVKKSEEKKIRKQVVIPLLQHVGTVCKPIVEMKDEVLVGQKIGDGDDEFSVPVHSSIAGEVVAIEERLHPLCGKVPSIIIESDETNNSIEFETCKNPLKGYIIRKLKDSGVVELNGFPLYNMLTAGKLIDTVLINLTSSGDVSSNYTPEKIAGIIKGMNLLIKASDAQQGAFIIQHDNSQLISDVESMLHEEKDIEIFTVKQDYTPSMTNLLTYEITGMQISNTCTPLDAGVLLSSASGALAVSKAVLEGIPQIIVDIAVSGAVRNPGIISAGIGTSIKDVIESCGGYAGEPGKIILNGILNGTALSTDEIPVIKSTSTLIIQSADEVLHDRPGPCIHCARCVDVCPVNILPGRIASFADMGYHEDCYKLHVVNCVECGLCSYVCPSRRHILQLIRYSKTVLQKLLKYQKEEKSPGCLSCETPCLAAAPFISNGGLI